MKVRGMGGRMMVVHPARVVDGDAEGTDGVGASEADERIYGVVGDDAKVDGRVKCLAYRALMGEEHIDRGICWSTKPFWD